MSVYQCVSVLCVRARACVCVCVCVCLQPTAHLNVLSDSVGQVKVDSAQDPLHKINQPQTSRLVEDEVDWAQIHLYDWAGN